CVLQDQQAVAWADLGDLLENRPREGGLAAIHVAGDDHVPTTHHGFPKDPSLTRREYALDYQFGQRERARGRFADVERGMLDQRRNLALQPGAIEELIRKLRGD